MPAMAARHNDDGECGEAGTADAKEWNEEKKANQKLIKVVQYSFPFFRFYFPNNFFFVVVVVVARCVPSKTTRTEFIFE